MENIKIKIQKVWCEYRMKQSLLGTHVYKWILYILWTVVLKKEENPDSTI